MNRFRRVACAAVAYPLVMLTILLIPGEGCFPEVECGTFPLYSSWSFWPVFIIPEAALVFILLYVAFDKPTTKGKYWHSACSYVE